MYQQVIKFWFEEITPEMWWKVDPEFDKLIVSRYLELMHQAVRGELYAWRIAPQGRLAEIIVLDQFSRNIFRNTPKAFAQDPMALALAQVAVEAQALRALSPVERSMLLMPFMHSESKSIHAVAERLFHKFTPTTSYEFELKHQAVIERFGRYPSRNTILGRVSTDDEIQYMNEHGAGF